MPPDPPARVNRLPVELLCSAFASLTPPTNAYLSDIIRFWILRSVIARVCKLWLSVLSGTVPVWNRIWIYPFTPPAFLDYVLKKASGLDLILHLDTADTPHHSEDGRTVRNFASLSPTQYLAMLDEYIRPRFPNVVELWVTADGVDIWTSLASRLASYSPNMLRFLALRNSHHSTSRESRGAFFNIASNLRKVAIAGFSPAGSLGMYAAVRSLELSSIFMSPGMPWMALRDALESCLSLERLVLNCVECIDINPASVANLPRLVELIVLPDDDACSRLLAQICALHLSHMEVVLKGTSTLASLTNSAGHLLRRTRTFDAAFFIPHGNGFVDFLTTLEQVRILDLRRTGGSSGYKDSSGYDDDARPLTELLRAMYDLPHILPCLGTVKVRCTSQATEGEVKDFMRAVAARCASSPWSLECYVGYRGGTSWSGGEGGLVKGDVPGGEPLGVDTVF